MCMYGPAGGGRIFAEEASSGADTRKRINSSSKIIIGCSCQMASTTKFYINSRSVPVHRLLMKVQSVTVTPEVSEIAPPELNAELL